MTTYESYTNSLIQKLYKNFDISEQYKLEKYSYDFRADLNIRNEKFVFLPDIKLYGFENNEYFLVRKSDDINLHDLQEELSYLKSKLKEIAPPAKEHMSSEVFLVLITQTPIPEKTEQFIRRFFRQKSYALGFKGWADLNVIVIALSEERVISHKKNKKTAAFFNPEAVVL
jgi:hypothetical protein